MSQEAFISLENVEQGWGWHRDGQEVFIMQAVLRNTGNTEARNMKTMIGYHTTDMQPDIDHLFDDFTSDVQFGVAIGANVPFRSKEMAMSSELAKEMWDKKKRVFIRVLAQYETVFAPARQRETSYDLEVIAFENPYLFRFENGTKQSDRVLRFNAIPKSGGPVTWESHPQADNRNNPKG